MMSATTPLKICNKELYTNLTNTSQYRYPRNYQTTVKFEKHQMTLNGTEYINVIVTGIPDGVSPLTNEALIPKDSIFRLYIFSEKPLTEEYLQTLDSFYGKVAYPNLTVALATAVIPNYPKQNFYMCTGPPSMLSEFTEYRYLQQRHSISNIAFDADSNSVYRLVMPERTLLVLIMPENFIKTGQKTGYFRFDNNIIVRVYSKYFLSSKYTDDNDIGEVTVFTMDNKKVVNIIRKFFSRLNLHKLTWNNSDHIYGYDNYLTAIVGNTSNVLIP